MADNFKLWSYQQKVEWLMEQVKKGTVDVEDLITQVETNKDNIETNKDNIETNTNDISDLKDANEDLDERVTALEESPAPTGGLEIINVSKGEYIEEMGAYSLTISEEDKAKVLANPSNCVLAFTETHVGTAYAYLSGVMDGVYEYIFNFVTSLSNVSGTFPNTLTIMIGVSENFDAWFESNNTTTLSTGTIECGVASEHALDLDSYQLMDIYSAPDKVSLKVQGSGYTVYLHYDGFANNTVFFSGTKPVSGASDKATFTIVNVMGTYTQYYNY